MPQNYQFVENLIQLREHYQSTAEDAERFSSQATKQLEHINALLVDQLVENQQIAQTLLQLRSHYQALHAQHQQKANSAKEQLNHVNALLADSSILQHNSKQPISIQAATLEQQALIGAIADNGEELHRQSLPVVQEPEMPDTSVLQITLNSNQEENDGAIAKRSKAAPQELIQVSPQIASEVSQVEQHLERELPVPPSVVDFSERSQRGKQAMLATLRHSAPLKTPLLPQYEHLNKSEAVEQLLQENEGRVLHVDYIIRALYGELTPEDVAAEKLRMNETLRKGVAKGLWNRVPDSPGCYTVDMKLVEKKSDSKSEKSRADFPPVEGTFQEKVNSKKHQVPKPNSKATEGMLPRYRNLNFTEAVETVLRDRKSEILTTDIVARVLYGELEGKALTEAKTKVGKTLWSGANQGR